jgi:hypothetical protein
MMRLYAVLPVQGYDAVLIGNWLLPALKMEAASSSEVTVNNYQTTRRHIPYNFNVTQAALSACQLLVYWVRYWCCYGVLIPAGISATCA